MRSMLINPSDIVDLGVPNYAHGIAMRGAEEWVQLSGQVGLRPDGTISKDFEGQCRQAFANIEACLRDADMTLDVAIVSVDDPEAKPTVIAESVPVYPGFAWHPKGNRLALAYTATSSRTTAPGIAVSCRCERLWQPMVTSG